MFLDYVKLIGFQNLGSQFSFYIAGDSFLVSSSYTFV